MPNPKTISPVQIATRQSDGVAIIYMYGIVGQEGEWWMDPEDRQETITAMAVVDALNELSAKFDEIQFRINSPGGSVFDGEAIVNAIQNCTAKVVTYNDGIAASMAATIFLAGHERHMGRNAKLMLHAPSSYVFGNAVDMRDEADRLDKFTEASAESIGALTEMSAEEVFEKFFADGKDHWLTFRDAVEMGFVSDDDGYQSAANPPNNVEQLSHLQLLQQFTAQPPRQERQSLIGKVRNWVTPQQTASTPENSDPVTPQELRAAIDAGDLTLEQVQQVVQEATPAPASDPQQALADTIQLAVKAGVETATQELRQEVKDLREEVKQLGDAPGAAPAGTQAGADPGSQTVTQVQKDAAYIANYARNGGNPFKNPDRQVSKEFLASE